MDELFAPGLEATAISSTLHGEGLPAPAEVVEWFTWHDGRGRLPTSLAPLGPTPWTKYSLREALRTRALRLQEAEYAASEDEGSTLPSLWWEPSWLPIADSGGQGVLTIDLRARSQTVAVRNVNWSHAEFRTVREDSLKDLIDVWIRIIQRGGWTWSSSVGLWEGDYASLPLELRQRSLM